MGKGVIGIIDSGIGGLNVLKEINRVVKGETFVYLGDNDNVPYGNRNDEELTALAFSSIVKLSEYKLKCVILACNTLSLTVRQKLEDIIRVPVFGVFPPVEKAVLSGKRCLLIATARTCEKYKETGKLKILPCKTLASDIEINKFSLKKIDLSVLSREKFSGFDTLILGCTHYEYIKNEILAHLNAKNAVSGTDSTVNQLNKWLLQQNNYKNNGENEIIFIGSSAVDNKNFWEKVVLNKNL